ncbi:iron-sulfur cluster carrier protein ApbC [Haliangium ochraceum]|uniref:Iron-sulfur cluster carrier protein n=1 Tax=Haliangium ochraceum (strain DSM 14365 / JCM 11303 / SMP-2) TaxID=502025 RepID=D0LH20_HALO1|nr:iron-sulfur cluster carrier protein ApbC [Haliangium ochraceum]ACY14742.1 ATPase-like, ParA/MinD [Haliangium ochraceum DSM 14365]
MSAKDKQLDEQRVKEILSGIEDPLLENDIVSYRIYQGCELSDGQVLVHLTIPTPAYPQRARNELKARIEKALGEAGATKVTVMIKVETAHVPPPSDKMALQGPKNVIAVAAGKGGVGKSTVATNLALALAKLGAKVGLLDADVFGPSIPTMLGPPEQTAGTTPEQKIIPALHHGIKVISVGFFVDKKEAVVWRGPMVHRLLQQFLQDVVWGDLDYLICDLPPGTGDVQLSLSQLIPIAGSVMVTTPQEVSLIDVVKGISMFEKVEIPVLGIVENMSYYVCPACGHKDEIFSHGGGQRLAQEAGLDFLGEVPIDARIRFGGDSGVPIVAALPDSEHARTFMAIATKAAVKIAKKILSQPRRSPRLAVIR